MALYSNDSNIRHINIYGLYEKEELEMLFNFFIKSKRACIAPNSGFKIGLREYERVLRERIPPAIYMKPTLCTLL